MVNFKKIILSAILFTAIGFLNAQIVAIPSQKSYYFKERTELKKFRGILELGASLPVGKWGSDPRPETSFLAPFGGSEGMGVTAGMIVSLGFEIALLKKHSKAKVFGITKFGFYADILTKAKWGPHTEGLPELVEEDDDVGWLNFQFGSYTGWGIAYNHRNLFIVNFIPTFYIPFVYSLPQYSFDYSRSGYSTYKGYVYPENEVIGSGSFIYGIGYELKFRFKNRIHVKIEYFNMRVRQEYIYESISLNAGFWNNTLKQSFISNYNIRNIRLGVGLNF